MAGNAEVPSSSVTNQSLKNKDGVTTANEVLNEEPRISNEDEGDQVSGLNPNSTTEELPTDVRVKLRKLDKLESRYNGSSRTIHVAGSS